MNGQTKLLFPGLAGFYTSARPIAYTLVRVVIGGILIAHGWGKVHTGLVGITAYMGKLGLQPALFFSCSAMFLETVGGACVLIGLFTRFFASALAVEMGIAFLVVHFNRGFGVSGGGYEYVLLLGIVFFAIAISGGGRYSADRLMGKEL